MLRIKILKQFKRNMRKIIQYLAMIINLLKIFLNQFTIQSIFYHIKQRIQM